MKEISLNILDIAQNSVKAGASLIEIHISEDESALCFSVKDNGCGMTQEFLQRVTDPFTTTRTTRKVGLGIPMLKQTSEMAGGNFGIESEVGVGTWIHASFDTRNIDCIPMGDICDSLLTLVVLNPERPEFLFQAQSPEHSALFDTRQLRQVLGGLPLNEPDIIAWMKESIEEEFKPILEVS